MRILFWLMILFAVAAFWAGRSIEGEEPQWRLIRGALYTASGIFVGLFVSAALQALLISE